MYQLNPNQANTQDIGIGTSGSPGKYSAQVFDPLPYIELGERDRAAKEAAEARKAAAKEKAENDRLNKLNAQIANLKDSIDPRDITHFTNLSKDLMNGVLEDADLLKAGDPGAWSRFNIAKQNYDTQVATSNNDLKDYLKLQSMVTSKGENTFYPETMEGYKNRNNPENVAKWGSVKQPIAIPKVSNDKYALDIAKKMMSVADTAGHPRIKAITAQEADIEAEKMATDPEREYSFLRQMLPNTGATLTEDQLNKLTINAGYDANGKSTGKLMLTSDDEKLKDTTKYAPVSKENIAKAQNSPLIEGAYQTPEPPLSQWRAQEFEEPSATPVTIKVNSLKKGGGTVERDVTSDFGQSTTTPVSVVNPTTATMRTMDGAKIPEGVEINEAKLGKVLNMPVWKDGTSLAGNLIPNGEVLEKAKKDKLVTYKPVAFGIAKQTFVNEVGDKVTEEINIYQSASENESALKKQGKINLDKFRLDADQKNAAVGGKDPVKSKAADKFISKKIINGVERSVYQRADGSKYAK